MLIVCVKYYVPLLNINEHTRIIVNIVEVTTALLYNLLKVSIISSDKAENIPEKREKLLTHAEKKSSEKQSVSCE